MGLRAVFNEALPGIFAAAGEDAVFMPAAGNPIPCKVFIDFDVSLEPAGVDARVWQQGTVIEALLSEIGREPDRGETFTIGSETFTVQAILENDRLSVKMQVT
ncbi:MAG: hypothetical protein RBT16_11305 [Desulfococcus multivorans]|jgi:hypothetical protein|nr:hypothetical protein [Desulfococcus multivorans]